jgi:predicted small lipoprotein YifL
MLKCALNWFFGEMKMLKNREFLVQLLAVFGLISCLSLAGCGTKGPLYIPEQRYPQTKEKSSAITPAANKHALRTNIHAASRAS